MSGFTEPRLRSLRILLLVVVGLAVTAALATEGSRPAAPLSAARTSHPPTYRYLYSSRHVARTAAADGWNLIDVSSKAEADIVPAGTRALVWIGDWDNDTCAWTMSDAELTRIVRSMVGDRKVVGYYFSDEPDPFACPSAPAAHAARSRLIRRIDPSKFTLLVIGSNADPATLKQIPLWRGAATYVGLDPYPCYSGKRCDFRWVQRVIAAADRAHLRYWGVVQAFRGSGWRWPTQAELAHLISIWATSHEQGSMTFAWRWRGHVLNTHPGLVSLLRQFNRDGSIE